MFKNWIPKHLKILRKHNSKYNTDQLEKSKIKKYVKWLKETG